MVYSKFNQASAHFYQALSPIFDLADKETPAVWFSAANLLTANLLTHNNLKFYSCAAQF